MQDRRSSRVCLGRFAQHSGHLLVITLDDGWTAIAEVHACEARDRSPAFETAYFFLL